MDELEMDVDLGVLAKAPDKYSLGEDIFSSISHGIGAGLAVAAIAILAVFAPKTPVAVTSVCIYGACLFMLYLMSCLYHALTNKIAKKVFQVFDHVSIYLLIAGSYTPFCLVKLGGAFGWTIFGVIWLMALIGIIIYSSCGNRMRKISSITYVIMGWMVLLCFIPLKVALSGPSFNLLMWGGVCYTVGFLFYSQKKVQGMHCVFHLFVLAGSILHFFSIFLAVCK